MKQKCCSWATSKALLSNGSPASTDEAMLNAMPDDLRAVLESVNSEFAGPAGFLLRTLADPAVQISTTPRLVPINNLRTIYRARLGFAEQEGRAIVPGLRELVSALDSTDAKGLFIYGIGANHLGTVFVDETGRCVGCLAFPDRAGQVAQP